MGCLLFLLCFRQHPYEDSAKLRIINAKYSIPANDAKYRIFHELIHRMFRVGRWSCQCCRPRCCCHSHCGVVAGFLVAFAVAVVVVAFAVDEVVMLMALVVDSLRKK